MSKLLSLVFTTFLFLGLFSCQKSLNTGNDLLPEDDNISILFNDTSTIKTATVRANPVRTDRLLLNHLGCMNDPVFGETKASTSFELGLPIAGLQQDTMGPYTIDSVVLKVAISDFYGDSSQPQYFNVHQIANLEQKLLDYESNEAPSLETTVVGSLGPHIPSLAKKLKEDTTYAVASLRFKIDASLGKLILDNLGNIDSYGDFENLLPGLALTVDSTQACGGGLYLLNFLSLNSSLSLHYKNSVSDTLVMAFPTFNSGFSRGVYTHDYSGTDITTALNDMNEDEDVSYIQGLAGVQTKIDLPFLMNYAGTAINKAEIEFRQVYDDHAETFRTPERLYLTFRDSKGRIRNLTDYSFGNTYYDGFRDSIRDENNNKIYKYVINISSHVQEVIDGKEDNTSLYLTTIPEQVYDGGTTNPSVILPDRLILGGSSNTVDKSRIKLNLKYTNIE